MSTYRLHKLFEPASVAVVGASPRDGALGGVVLRALQQGGYKGALTAINPKHDHVLGVPCVASLDRLGVAPDLVIVTTPAHAVAGVIDDAVRADAQAAIVSRMAGVALATVHVYPGVDHAFCRAGGEHYDATDAALAGQRGARHEPARADGRHAAGRKWRVGCARARGGAARGGRERQCRADACAR
jgi:predicted CoA-binding protein